jgi:D-xylose transport system ATP-binding protein
MSPSDPILDARRIIKRFGPVTALGGVDFNLHPGEIHALCGENGAGKSTLIKTLSGIYPHGSFEGDLHIAGKPANFRGVSDARAAGIAVIFQELALVDEMTVAENIYLGQEPTINGRIDWPAVYQGAAKLLNRFHITLDAAQPVRRLGVGERQLVEIVKALAKDSRILILDEPTAALSETEVDVLLDILRDLRARGMGCVYISHKLGEVFAVADRITVLRDGRSVATMRACDTTKTDVIRHMVGREITQLFPRRKAASRLSPSPGTPGEGRGEGLLSVTNLSVNDFRNQPRLKNISFDVRAGEVLGIGGLMGAGRSELLLHIFGAYGRRTTGNVTLAGQSLQNPTPQRCIARGLVMVCEERKRQGIIAEKTIGFNLSLSSLDRLTRLGLLNHELEVRRNQEMFTSLSVRATGLEALINRLSGGNQQKVVLGKALLTNPKVVFLDEPTRGIDVGAKQEVYELINRLTDDGRAVVLVSSELPELMGMSDRILMLSEGRVGGLFTREQATPDNLLAAAISAHRAATTIEEHHS